MNYRPHVLLADNHKGFLNAFGKALELEGYHVFLADSADVAKKVLRRERVHVAVIDIRLEDDNDPHDRSGLELATCVDDVVSKVLISNYEMTIDDVYKVYGSIPAQIEPTPLFVPKRAGTAGRLEAVRKAFRSQVEINDTMEVKYRKGASPRDLVAQIRHYKGIPESEKDVIAQEVDDLLRKLFSTAESVTVYSMTPGRGGSGVVRVVPRHYGMKGGYVVVKFGRRASFKEEVCNYHEYVDPFLPRFATFMRGEAAWTQRLGGAKFLFVGMSEDEPGDFRDFYRKASDDSIRQAVRRIFTKSWAVWYDNVRDWDERKHPAPQELYAGRLFSEQRHWDELRDSVSALLDGESFRGLSLRPADQAANRIEIQMRDKKWLLPDPVHFLTSQSDLLPAPKYVCFIHGDLNPTNIFIDESLNAWLIDFFKTGKGPALRDVADLESSIKFQLLSTNNLAALIEFESALLAPQSLNEKNEFKNAFNLQQLDRALVAIQELRSVASGIVEDQDVKEYYASLLFLAAKMITWGGVSSQDAERQPIRQRHALFSAALICEKFLPETEETEEVIV
jgi:DNA-binding NarL/FixJ family response regulator